MCRNVNPPPSYPRPPVLRSPDAAEWPFQEAAARRRVESGRLTLQLLRQDVADRVPGATVRIAAAFGLDIATFHERVASGQISLADVVVQLLGGDR